MADERTVDMAKGTCTEDSCGRDAKTRGLCNRHYLQRWKAGPLPPLPPRPPARCEIDGCEREHHSQGFCNRHFRQRLMDGLLQPAQDFWSYVEKTETCWLWTGPIHNGYGRFSVGVEAHRYAYQRLVGPIPDGLMLDHRATCPKHCVNPAHLKPVTNKQNLENRAGATRKSSTGVRGVCWNGRKWLAHVGHNGRLHGSFTRLYDAECAVRIARIRLHSNYNPDDVFWFLGHRP
jgi:HNH endonuclease